MNTLAIKQMNTAERLQIMEAVRDSLLYDDTEIESPQWHESVVSERKKKLKKAGQSLFPSKS